MRRALGASLRATAGLLLAETGAIGASAGLLSVLLAGQGWLLSEASGLRILEPPPLGLLPLCVFGTAGLSALVSILPTLLIARSDPADIIRSAAE